MTDARKALVEEAKRIDAASTPGPWGEDDGNVFCRPLADARHEACVAKVEGRPYEADHLAFDAFVCTTEQRHPESDADATFIARARTLLPALATALEACEAERDLAVSALREIGDRWQDGDPKNKHLLLHDLSTCGVVVCVAKRALAALIGKAGA